MLDVLCKLLGIREDQAEDALRSERCARLTLSRRSLFGAALCTGAAFSFGAPALSPLQDVWHIPSYAEWLASEPGAGLFHAPRAVYKRIYGAQIEAFKRSIDWSDEGGLHKPFSREYIARQEAWADAQLEKRRAELGWKT